MTQSESRAAGLWTGSKKEGAEVTQSKSRLWTESKKERAEATQSETRAVDRK